MSIHKTAAIELTVLPASFLERYEVNADTGCWDWIGMIDADGYGTFSMGHANTTRRAHRVSYTVAKGPIPAGRPIDHLCRNRRCVNPAHLEVVTVRENTLRGDTLPARNAAKTTCIKGHPFDGVQRNRGTTQRTCSICHRDKLRALRARRRQAALPRLTVLATVLLLALVGVAGPASASTSACPSAPYSGTCLPPSTVLCPPAPEVCAPSTGPSTPETPPGVPSGPPNGGTPGGPALAQTGAPVGPLVAALLVLFGLGGALVRAGRRRTAGEHR